MKLVIDAVGNKSGGGATVLLEILEVAVALPRITGIILLASPAALRNYKIPDWEKLRTVDVPEAESSLGRFVWAWRGLAKRLGELECDAFLGLNGIGGVQKTCASLVFIQQPVPYSSESLRRCSWRMRFRMGIIRRVTQRSARAADHVLVQSEAMRETISRAFDISPARISVFMPGAPVLPQPTTDSPKLKTLRSDSRSGTVLYVGSDSPHKNLSVVLQGLQRLPEAKRPKWYVTLPGNGSFCRQGFAIGLGTLNGAELHEAYRNATVVVMPSLTETVGLPMLEAMRLGTPVLAADRPYAHAVCEDAAAFFNPLSPDDFASQVKRLLTDVQWRSQLVSRGYALIKRRDGMNPYRGMLEKVVEVADQVAENKVCSTKKSS